MRSSHPFFSYDPEGDGFQIESSFENADTKSKLAIREYLDDSWMEEVEGVCMGVILKKATLTTRIIRPLDSELDDEGYDSGGQWWGRTDNDGGIYEFDEMWNFTLESQKIPDEVLNLIPTSDLVRELSRREGVELFDAPNPSFRYMIGVGPDNKSAWDKYEHDSGPVKILVVKD